MWMFIASMIAVFAVSAAVVLMVMIRAADESGRKLPWLDSKLPWLTSRLRAVMQRLDGESEEQHRLEQRR